MRRRIQEKVGEVRRKNQLPRKHRRREGERIRQIIRRAAKLAIDPAAVYEAEILVERLKDVTWRPKGYGELRHRLRSFPYRMATNSIKDKAVESGRRAFEADAKRSSIEHPARGYAPRGTGDLPQSSSARDAASS